MYNFFRQNKNILIVSLGVFIVSMTLLLIFLNTENKGTHELKADVINSEPVPMEDEETAYRELFQNHEDPVLMLGLDGKIDFASKDILPSTGFTEADMENTLLSSYIHPDDLPVFFAAFGKAIATGKAVTMIGPFRVRDMNGQYHYYMGSVYPVLQEDNVSGVGMTMKDITDHLDQYIRPEEEEVGTEDEELLEDEQQAPVTKVKTVKNKTNLENDDAPREIEEPVKWQKPKKIKSDPSWITGEKIVMMFPFRLPLFPAHLLLAQQ